jgi:branched-chain amino acid transport system ATP-binding protein
MSIVSGSETAAIRVDKINAGYSHVPVLRDLSFHVDQGECVALLGPNGVGKTTTMWTILGSIIPTSGSVWWENQRIDHLPPHRTVSKGIAIVPEGRRLYGGMSVEENLLVGAYQAGKAETRQRLAKIYDTFPILNERRHQLAGTMSGGQQQVCAIGRALMSNPRLLLIDELSLGLSPAAIGTVVEALKVAIAYLKPTLILVDQDVTLAQQLATRGYFLERGSVVAEGPLSELVKADRIRELYFATGRESATVN